MSTQLRNNDTGAYIPSKKNRKIQGLHSKERTTQRLYTETKEQTI